jgi:hypothetical protein
MRPAEGRHVLVLSFNSVPPPRVVRYLTSLHAAGVEVDAIVVDLEAAEVVRPTGARIHTLYGSELSTPLRRIAGFRPTRILGVRIYGLARSWLLARRARATLAGLHLEHTDRIVAADLPAVTLGWRLARRYPRAVATTALEP